MERTFPETLSALRRDRSISQRKAAADLNISQALLSHYENGVREPGLSFVCRACDYYGVSADYLLCRSDNIDPCALLKNKSLAALLAMEELVKLAREEIRAFSIQEEEE